MQSATGQYSTQAGEPAQPVQHSVITASSFGFFFRGVVRPVDLGSNLSSSGTIPAALVGVGLATVSGAIECLDYIVKSGTGTVSVVTVKRYRRTGISTWQLAFSLSTARPE